ncbi:MAG: hypothetical protein RLZ19_630 [Actinomycetota bacterium]|jgi:hypothetical protein
MTLLKLPRPLHVIDIDNLMGDPRVIDPWIIGKWKSAYVHVTGLRPGDHAIVGTGCNGKHAFAVQSKWNPFRVVRQPGPDGADEALIEAAITEAERGRYTHFVIGSGDHRFADLYDELVDKRYPVTVVSRSRSLSRALRSRAGDRVLYLPDLDLV